MNKRVQKLLQNLRLAVDEALAGSSEIGAAMVEFEQLGLVPSLAVEVELPEVPEPTLLAMGPLSLTARDEQFLKDMGIQTQEVADACGY